MKRKLSILLVMLAVAALISVAGSAQTGKRKAPAKGKAAKGVDAAALYKQHCAKCHAADGKGIESLEPPDMTTEKWQTETTDEAITNAINEGKGIMPGFSDTLKPAEITAMVKFLRTLGPAKN
ncbi:MAG: cytochrome c [Blastocatellales bacterium]